MSRLECAEARPSHVRRGAAPIGVFDSGVGGLTVLREVYRQLPHESVIYFGDTARLPYGTRSPAEIRQFVREILTWMQQQGTKMVIMACNTSSALALETVRSEFDMPILGLILPGARSAVRRGRRIGVIATPATAASHAYRNAILEVDATAQVWQVGCPAFVPLIEQNQIHTPEMYRVCRDYLAPLMAHHIDTLIFGCTHYPYLTPVLEKILPPTVQFVNPAVSVVAAAAKELEVLSLENHATTGVTRFCVSRQSRTFSTLAQQWLGVAPRVETVKLPQLAAPSATDIARLVESLE